MATSSSGMNASPSKNEMAPMTSSPSKSLLQLPGPVAAAMAKRSRSRSPVRPALSASSSAASVSSDSAPPPAPAKRKRQFHRELKHMMHGFGDDPNPYTETLDLVEDLVLEFINEMTRSAMEVGKSGKIHINDIVFLIRKDRKKYARVRDLLRMNEELKKARKDFIEADI